MWHALVSPEKHKSIPHRQDIILHLCVQVAGAKNPEMPPILWPPSLRIGIVEACKRCIAANVRMPQIAATSITSVARHHDRLAKVRVPQSLMHRLRYTNVVHTFLTQS